MLNQSSASLMNVTSSVPMQPSALVQTSGDKYIINTGAGLTIITRQASCDFVVINYNDQEPRQHGSRPGKVVIQSLNDVKKPINVNCKKRVIEESYSFCLNKNVAGITAIEATDVVTNAGGTTRSKYYPGLSFVDDAVHGVNSTAAGLYLVISEQGYETSSGGPFFRDINNKLGAGPDVSTLDFSFFQDQELTGFVPDAKCGEVAGTITDANDVLGDSEVVVVFSNADAQYWVKVPACIKTFTSPKMKPGTY
ncbi:hypothetical protein PHYSODRAFT_343357 [Phytophthora sojae]|uniref:Uncharacterized protein n=1 Tax=Phytophthora sojae (strain P6497) TaxID=1094619 RepID=G5AJF3_PHYSP|nr:hypothetical protein PHYSODRAFT_343357 [Phytophthora sojae]EGZ04348.1 hypothetical protein PHYSODRAFT_343357 [Phytophthora sojae]|eukprot:XP_009540204.1 hypothetical protein PHYSODRAFT_343357 [Phytophthora sojae]